MGNILSLEAMEKKYLQTFNFSVLVGFSNEKVIKEAITR